MAAFEYTYAPGAYHKVDASTAGAVLDGIRAKTGREDVTPEELLDASRDADSPTHAEFDWDDSVAAHKWRLEQARLIIAHIRIIRADSQSEYKERAFVSAPGGNHAYVPLETALGKEEYREHLLNQAKKEMTVFIAKYRRIKELAKVIDDMTEFLQVG